MASDRVLTSIPLIFFPAFHWRCAPALISVKIHYKKIKMSGRDGGREGETERGSWRGEKNGTLFNEIFSKLGFFIFPTEVFSSLSSQRSLVPTGQRHQRSLSAFLFVRRWFISTHSIVSSKAPDTGAKVKSIGWFVHSLDQERRFSDERTGNVSLFPTRWTTRVGTPVVIPLIQVIQRREHWDGSSAETFIPTHTWPVAAAVWSGCESHFHRKASRLTGLLILALKKNL